MDNVQLIKEAARKVSKKVAQNAAKKTAKRAAKKKAAKKPAKVAKQPTLHEKVDKLTTSMAKANKPKPKKPVFKAKKLGLIAAGAAGAGALVAKVRQSRMEEE